MKSFYLPVYSGAICIYSLPVYAQSDTDVVVQTEALLT